MFVEAIGKYHRYTHNQSVLLVPWAISGIFVAIALLFSGFFLFRLRGERADTVNFNTATALVMALSVLVVPMYAPYNQVILLPVILVLVRDRTLFTSRSRGVRFLYLGGGSCFRMAVDRKLWFECGIFVWIASVGAWRMEVAFLCDVLFAGTGLRVDFSRCPR